MKTETKKDTPKHKQTFYLHSGKKLNTLKSLAKELQTISKATFEHHVSEHKNDFSSWIKHSLKQEKLAKNIEKRLNKVEIELEVLRHLVHEKSNKSTVKTTQKTVKPKTKSKK